MPKQQGTIDQYACFSKLKSWNAAYKTVFALLGLSVVLMIDTASISIMTVVFMGYLSVVVGKINIRSYMKLLFMPAMFVVMSGIAVLLQVGAGTGSIFYIPFFTVRLYITEASLEQAMSLGSKAFGAISAWYMLVLSTPMGEIIAVFRKMHVPHIILELMHLIYRYIFILLDINKKQKDAAQARLGYCDYRTSLRTFGSQAANLFVLSIQKSGTYYDALEARGYDGSCLFWEEKRALTWPQLLWGIVYAGFVILLRLCF